MKKILILFLLLANVSFGQNMKISATLVDTNSQTPIRNAIGIAVRVKDSVLVGFQRSDKYGKINMTLPYDTVQFTIKHPDFADFKSIFLGSATNNELDLGQMGLPDKTSSIGEVVIYANRSPIYFRGDTMVFIADSFKVAQGAVVEDLLKKLPGIKVDKEGKITNQGKEINQVLVDGDEFFGSDPTIATKNLAAEGVETVEIYEKDAEDGSDDKVQVLDLKLKDEAKKGYFGKTSIAGGLNQFTPTNYGFYEGEALFNVYNNKQKLGFFALTSNTPKTALNGRDLYKFGVSQGGGWNFDDSDDMSMQGNNGLSEDEGVPSTIKAGMFIEQKLWKGGEARLNYTFSKFDVNSKKTTFSQYNLTDTTYFTDETDNATQSYIQNAVSLKFNQKIDSLSDIEIEPKLTLNKTTTGTNNLMGFIDGNNLLSRTTSILNDVESNGLEFNTAVRYTRKFKKKNRVLKARYNLGFNDDNSATDFETIGMFTATPSLADTLFQNRKSTNNNISHTGYVNFVEPISKKWKLEFDYEFYSNDKAQQKLTYTDQAATIDSSFSNRFETTRLQQKFGVFGIYEFKKIRFSLGTRVRTVSIDNMNVFTNTLTPQSLTNLLPRATFLIKFSNSSRINIRYNTGSSLPSINDLQPVPDNSNPNYVKLGNPDLKPNYSHTISINQNMWKGLSGFYTYSGLWLNLNQNDFSSSTTYDNFGRAVSQTVNVDNNFNSSLWGGMGFPIPKAKNLRGDFGINAGYSNTQSFVDSLKNIAKTTSAGFNLSLEFEKDSLSLRIGYDMNASIPKNSLATFNTNPFTNYTIDGSIRWIIPGKSKITIRTDADYTISTGRTSGYNLNYVVWNASIERAFTKNNNLRFAIEANDILNQNISNNRYVQGNIITDQNVTLIRRYFMARLTYRFNNFKTTENDFEGWH
jgi:outer membrane receptor protein involved in Fe transport